MPDSCFGTSDLPRDTRLVTGNHRSRPLKRRSRPGQASARTSKDPLAGLNALRLSGQQVGGPFVEAFSAFVQPRSPPSDFPFLSIQPALALIGLRLPLVRNPLALVGDSLALIRDQVTLDGDAIARPFLGLDPIEPLRRTSPDFRVDVALVSRTSLVS
ncbi:MAG TPA: hypothetical protein VJS19_00470 [Candidatus Dormibacteraeota bacterium]|nr:hypothetical protein [Candidatus Dormibacteraeota bacterium]